MECNSCQFENPEGMNFCGKCGSSLTVACSSCGHQNPAGSEFCDLCNEKIVYTDVVPAYANRSALEYTPRFLLEKAFKYKSTMIGERKLVSVLFADVADFTTIAEKLDPEDVHEIMDGCFGILGREIHQAGGTINQYTGDGVMALFGAPIAYDNHIRPACHAALRVQGQMKEFHRKIFKRYDVTFRLRIGIHTGPVVVGAIGDNLRLDYTAVGDTTNLAARLESMAEPGTILVSERVFQNAKDHFLFDNGGKRVVKGKKEPVEVFLLVRERIVKHVEGKSVRAGIPFVGRDREAARLEKAFKEAIEKGPIIAAVTGEAGIGKTSLFKHFRQFVVKERALFLEGRCGPYGQLTALFPLKRMFRSYFDLREEDSDDQVQSKIRSMLKGTGQLASLDHLFDFFSGAEKKMKISTWPLNGKRKPCSGRFGICSYSSLKTNP